MSGADESDLTKESISEVELSAQDLLELSPSLKTVQPEHCATPLAVEPVKESVTVIEQPVHMHAAATPADRRTLSASRVTLACSVAVAAVVGAVALYKYSTPDPPVQSSMTTQPSMTTLPQTAALVEESAGTPIPPDSERQVVRFANPFDKSEVFEFPAGTSKAEARDAVADLLMKRAMERRDQLDARLSQRR